MMIRSFTVAGLVATLSTSCAFADSFTMWIRGSSDSFKIVADAYNASHDNKVEFVPVPGDQMVQKYAAAVAAGNAPDAVSLDLIYTPAFAAAGQLEDITDWVNSLPYAKELAPSHVKLGMYDGKNYGVPFWIETSVLAWNKKLYAQAGLDPEKAPTSWDEIRANAAKIRALGDDTYGFYFSGNCGGCAAFTFMPLIWGDGGNILSDDGMTVMLDNEHTRAAVDIYRGLVADGVVPESAATDNGANFMAITSGKIGQQLLGASGIPSLARDFPDLDFGVGLIPGAKTGFASFAGGDNFVLTKGTPKKDQVFAFLDWVYSVDGQIAMSNFGSLPARADTAAEVLSKADPRLKVGADAVGVSFTPYTVKYNDLFNSANGPWAAFMNSAIYGDDVDGAFATATADMEAIIAN